MQALRAHYKNSRIVFLTTPAFKPLLASSPWCDEIWTVNRWSWMQAFKWIGFARALRAQNFAHVYDLQRNDRARIMSYLAPRPLQQKWYGKKGSPHIPTFGELRYEDIPMPGQIDTSWLTADIVKYQLPARYAMLVPGCSPGHPYKRWPAAHYARTVHHLHSLGIASILIGTEAEKAVLDEIIRLAPSAINLYGRTSLYEIAEIARQAQIAVGNDTGPMHIAGIVGCPVIALFSGKTSPERSQPLGQTVVTLQAQHIADIAPADVFAHIDRILTKR